MQIIEATWEKRNLGVTCIEAEVEKQDNPEEVLALLSSRNEEYHVVKVPPGRTDIMLELQKQGYSYIESLFQTEHHLSQGLIVPEKLRKFEAQIEYHIAEPKETELVISFISSGSIFSTDRIALDPFFSRELAGKRYAYWMKDVLSSDSGRLYITKYKGDSIGFNAYIDKGEYYIGFLGGLLPAYLDSGFGVLNMYAGTQIIHKQKIKKVISHVSSNNLQMLKLHLLFGNQITNITDNFIKHLL